jgi:hypothetical protein
MLRLRNSHGRHSSNLESFVAVLLLIEFRNYIYAFRLNPSCWATLFYLDHILLFILSGVLFVSNRSFPPSGIHTWVTYFPCHDVSFSSPGSYPSLKSAFTPARLAMPCTSLADHFLQYARLTGSSRFALSCHPLSLDCQPACRLDLFHTWLVLRLGAWMQCLTFWNETSFPVRCEGFVSAILLSSSLK